MQLWENYLNTHVRNLAWAISSPALILFETDYCAFPSDDWYLNHGEEFVPLLDQLEKDPAPLNSYLKQLNSNRLGIYFEKLFLFWLQNNPRYQILHNNLQVQSDLKTVGEFDIILYDKIRAKTQHWELACKFYLGLGDTRSLAAWHGPNSRDRLDIKLAKTIKHQCQLMHHPAAKTLLNKLNITIDEKISIFKGYLFYPKQPSPAQQSSAQPSNHINIPQQVNPNHLSGLWQHQKEFIQYPHLGQWYQLAKSNWFTQYPQSSNPVQLSPIIKNELSDRSMYGCRIVGNAEIERQFITPNHWPKVEK